MECFRLLLEHLGWIEHMFLSGWIYCYDPETKRQSSQWKHAGSPKPKKARQSKSTHKLSMIPFFDSWWISKMQSEREDILEERYAIKSCFKLGKN